MIEQDQGGAEFPHNTWVYMKEMSPIDFWVGAQYKGNYNQQLQLDLPGLEAICRDNDFPPIILRSDAWDPPAVHTPETVAPGLSALKKTAFSKNPDVPEMDREYYRLTATEEAVDGYPFPMTPIGWDIRIKDRKILHDYTYKHPDASKSTVENAFVRGFDNVLRKALTEIAIREILAVRNVDNKNRSFFVSLNAFIQACGMVPGGFVSFKSVEAFVFTQSSYTALYQEFIGFLHLNTKVHTSVDTGRKMMKYVPDGHHRLASYMWRLRHFPDREESYFRNLDVPTTMATVAIPGGLFFEQLYGTYLSLLKHRSSLIRLVSQ